MMAEEDRAHLSQTPMGRHLLATGHSVTERLGEPWQCRVCDAHGDTPAHVWTDADGQAYTRCPDRIGDGRCVVIAGHGGSHMYDNEPGIDEHWIAWRWKVAA